MAFVRLPTAVGLCVWSLAYPAVSSGQSFQVQASAGPTISDKGHSVAAGIGISPASRVTFLIDVDRTHVGTSVRYYPDGNSVTRGGTYTMAAVTVRVSLFRLDRIGPYGLFGAARGVSRPNVNDMFPDRVTHAAAGAVAGGGIHVPLKDRLSLFAEVRIIAGPEGREGMFGVAPLRGGLAWRF